MKISTFIIFLLNVNASDKTDYLFCKGAYYDYYFKIEKNKCNHYQTVTKNVPGAYEAGMIIDGFELSVKECLNSYIEISQNDTATCKKMQK